MLAAHTVVADAILYCYAGLCSMCWCEKCLTTCLSVWNTL